MCRDSKWEAAIRQYEAVLESLCKKDGPSHVGKSICGGETERRDAYTMELYERKREEKLSALKKKRHHSRGNMRLRKVAEGREKEK